MRSTLPDGTSLFEKTRSKKRRPFTAEEDQALKAGYEKYGTVWSTIVKDPIFQEQKRRSTDLRDRFRNAFPHLYQAAGYKPRSVPKKKRGDINVSAPRVTADDQLLSVRMTTPARRRRSRTTPGYSYSVPQSAACSEDEESSDDDDDVVEIKKPIATFVEVKEMTPQPEGTQFNPEAMLNEVTMHTIDQIDPLADMSLPDFMPDSSQTLSDSTDQSGWSGQHSSPQMDSWSSAATTTTASPTSSQISVNEYFMDSTFSTLGRRDGMNMIGKSAWDPSDWLSGNPRLDPSGASTSSNSSFVGGASPPPSSPFSFSQLSHGIMDRYDLFQNSFAHDFASEVGASDAYSTFSDPELFPTQSMRGFTHHSNYAGDLIFGARTHQPQGSMNPYSELSLSHNSAGLGLSGMGQQAASINPMQLHTPSLPGIDELAAISLDDDDEPMITSTTAEVGVQKDDTDASPLFDSDLSSLIHLPPQTLEEIAGLSSDVSEHMEQELAATPPATPAHSGRVSRELHSNQYSSLHNRSMSVPPFERVPVRPPPAPGHATPHPPPIRSLSLFDIPPFSHDSLSHDADPTSPLHSNPSQSNSSHANNLQPSSFFNTSFINDSFKSLDLSDLLFLDLHAPGGDMTHHDIIDTTVDETRGGQALDLAQTQTQGMASAALKGLSTGLLSGLAPNTSALPLFETIGRAAGSVHHHRGQSAVSPKDLLLSASDNKHKRASWDGMTT